MTADLTIGEAHRQLQELQARLQESEETLEAIRNGQIDAVVVTGAANEHRVFTLENADRPYRVLIEQIGEGAVTLDADGAVFYCNRRLAEMLGLQQERVVGKLLQSFLSAAERGRLEAMLQRAHHAPARDEFTIARADGVEAPVVISLSLLQRDDGRAMLCGVLADLTQQRRHMSELSDANALLVAESRQRALVEDALRQSQKMEAVGQLTGGLAHDFNNLLTGIVGSLELMQARVAQGRTAELSRYVAAAMGSANRAAALTHRLLAFSRRQTLDPKLVMVNQLVAGMEELLQRSVGSTVTLATALDESAGTILCDASQLENALLNLAINARDAMPTGGTMTISTRAVSIDQATAAQRDMAPGVYVALAVGDTGVGMSPEVAARAFDPFFTTKPLGQGTGLGLSMIYGFTKQSGGQARIHSAEGLGASVTLFLPRLDTAQDVAASLASPQAEECAETGETVLIVDDEPVIRLLVSEVLRDLGYAALQAADGAAGLRHIAEGPRIDLLVTDVGLPGGMNGRQLADAARARQPDLLVLFITGFAENAAVGGDALEPGMGVMVKPFGIDALATKIRAMLREGRA